jgi:hypothetical protein
MRTTILAAALTACALVGCEKAPAPGAGATSSANDTPSAEAPKQPAAAPAETKPASPAATPTMAQTPPPGNNAAAATEALKTLLAELAQPGGDPAKLKPTEADIKNLFDDATAPAIVKHVDAMYKEGGLKLTEKPSEVHCYSGDDIKAWTKPVEADLPGGYKRVGPRLKPGVTVCRAKVGTIQYDGFMLANGKWVLVPKPFRAIKE